MVKEEKLSAYTIAGQFVTDRYCRDKNKTLRWWRDEFYVWDNGSYHRITDAELKCEVIGYLHEKNIPVSTHSLAIIILSLCDITKTGRDVKINSWLEGSNGARVFPMGNGNVSFTDRDKSGRPMLLPNTPLYFTLAKVDYDYDPKAKCHAWDAFLHDIMSKNKQYISLLQQWCGYLLRPDLKEHKFLLCTGEGSNGKSVFFEVVKGMLGNENCSQVGLIGFNPKFNRFGLYDTLGKMVNMTAESSHIIEEEAETNLKSFVAGDQMCFERKFREPLSATPTAKIMIATNSPPRFRDKTQATWRRILLVPFKEVYTEETQVKDLADILKKELPGIFNWALEGLKKLNKQGRFTKPDDSMELLEEYRKDSDPARAFLMENYLYSDNGEGKPCAEVYEEYKQYCETNNCHAMGNRLFGRHVHTVFPKAERVKWGTREERIWTYKGLVSYVAYETLI